MIRILVTTITLFISITATEMSSKRKCDPRTSYEVLHLNEEIICQCRPGFVKANQKDECVRDGNYMDEHIPDIIPCLASKSGEYTKNLAISLLSNYDRFEVSTNRTVAIELTIETVEINESKKRAELTAIVSQHWRDQLLNYSQHKDVECIDRFVLSQRLSSGIWFPDVAAVNAKVLQQVSSMPVVFSDGRVEVTQRLSLEVPCKFELRSFPMDKVECPVAFQSSIYPSDRLRLIWLRNETSLLKKLEAGNFVLKKQVNEQTTEKKPMMSEWDQLHLKLIFRRSFFSFYKPTVQIMQTYLPSYCAVYIALLSIFLGQKLLVARAILNLFLLMFLSVRHAWVTKQFARASYITTVDAFSFGSMGITALILIEIAVVLIVEKRRCSELKAQQLEVETCELTDLRASTKTANRGNRKDNWKPTSLSVIRF
ncbi:Neurotransmitter-gated ion-channel ligand binding domain protein [Aphelenchoides besseyi]|nr:Neurotransmitter-gated ion-channel ligand binding domain protein [Aphelenchoides besseyi]